MITRRHAFYHACQIHASRWYHAIWRVRLDDFQINAHQCNSRIHIIFSAQQWRQFAKLQSLRYNVGYFNFVGYHYNRWASSYTVASVCTHIRIKIYREKMQLFFCVLFFASDAARLWSSFTLKLSSQYNLLKETNVAYLKNKRIVGFIDSMMAHVMEGAEYCLQRWRT